MKTMLLAAAGIAALAIATPAFANGDNTGEDHVKVTINAHTDAKCDLTAGTQTVSLGDYDITNSQGIAKSNIGAKVADALNGANITAWCTGANNSFIISRSSLNTGNGQATNNGFNKAVIYDVEAFIDGASRVGGGGPVNEGTSDGPALGPVITRFGPTGVGEQVRFRNEPENAVSSAVDNGSNDQKPRNGYGTENNNRLVAGNYDGTLTVSITPGV